MFKDTRAAFSLRPLPLRCPAAAGCLLTWAAGATSVPQRREHAVCRHIGSSPHSFELCARASHAAAAVCRVVACVRGARSHVPADFASCQESLQAHEPRVKSLSYCASSLSSPTRVLYRMPRSVPGLHHACMHSDFRFPSRERQEPRTWPGGQGQGPWRRGHQRRRVRSCWWWAATSPRSWAAPESPRCSCASRARRCLSSLLVNILPSFPRCSRSTFAPHNALSGPNFSSLSQAAWYNRVRTACN